MSTRYIIWACLPAAPGRAGGRWEGPLRSPYELNLIGTPTTDAATAIGLCLYLSIAFASALRLRDPFSHSLKDGFTVAAPAIVKDG